MKKYIAFLLCLIMMIFAGSYATTFNGIKNVLRDDSVAESIKLETEVNNGGLCQFFVNSSRIVAPFVSEYMAIVGAFELYLDFINIFLSLLNLSRSRD